jgi:nitroreductase
MDVFEAIATRRSIRSYRAEPIPQESIKRIMEAARLAPSAGNRQPWRFVVTKDPKIRSALARAANNQDFVGQAPVVVTVLGDPAVSERWHLRDPMIAAEHIALQAVEEGLGTCWIGAFDETEVKKVLNVPEGLRVVCILPIGKPAEAPAARTRKALAELFFEDVYGNPWKDR